MSLSRRRVLKGAGGMMAAAVTPSSLAEAARQNAQVGGRPAEVGSAGDVTSRLARYMAEARDRQLPETVARDARHRILDTLGAIVSGAALSPGVFAARYVRAQGGTAE